MSRNVPAALQAYMEGHGLHMCKIVKVGPFPDGTYRGLADLDVNLAYDDGEASGEITYIARTGVQISALATSADLGVDNAEMDTLPPVTGFEMEGITADQIKAGALDAVPYVVYCLNYEDTSMGHFVWSGGTLGEARIKNTALFNFEQRSISNQLKQIIGNVDSTTCRAKFGSMPIGTVGAEVTERFPCEYDAESEWTAFTVTAADPDDPDMVFFTGLTQADDYFRPGKVRMLTGANAGLEREVGAFANTSGAVTLSYAFPEPLAADDEGEIRRECTKHWTGHNSCDTFHGTDKILHFRGEPHIPVGDAAMSFTGATGSLGGTGEVIVAPPAYPEPVPSPTPSVGGGSYTTRTRGATVVDPVTYGADPTGVADSTAAFNDAYAALPVGGGIVRPSAGTYKINPVVSIKPLSNTLLDLAANSVTLRASYTALDHKYVVHVDQKTEVEIAGGTIVGYRDAWSPISGTTSEWGHGIFVEGGSAITIRDMTIHKCVGDGISLGKVSAPTAPDDVQIVNVLSTNNRRQGFTVGRSTNVLLRECEGSYTGGTNGTAPKAGLDIEPDNPDTQNSTNTVIDSCYFHHNDGPGIIAYRSADQVTITGTVLEYNSYGLLTTESTTGTFTGNTIQHNRYNGAKFTGGTTGWTVGGASTLKNRFFNNHTALRGTITTGTTATISGTSSATSDHIRVESSTVTVVTNDFGPT